LADFEVYGKIVPVQADISALQKSVQSYFDKNPIVIKTTFGGTSGNKTGFSTSTTVKQAQAQSKIAVAGYKAEAAASTASAAASRARTAAINSGTAALRQQAVVQKQADDALKQLAKDKKAQLTAEKDYNNLILSSQRYYEKIKNNANFTSELRKEWDSYYNTLRSGAKPTEEMSAQFAKLKVKMADAGVEANSFGQKMKDLFTRHWNLAVIMTAVHFLKQAIREVIENVTELNAELVQFQIVSGSSDSEMQSFADGAMQAAEEVSAAVTDIVNAATVYKRLGYSTEEALDFSKLTTMLSRVGAVDISDAENAVTAMIEAFDLSAEDLQLALDQMVWVGKVYCPAA